MERGTDDLDCALRFWALPDASQGFSARSACAASCRDFDIPPLDDPRINLPFARHATSAGTAKSAWYSSSVKRREAAATFCARCSIEQVPRLGNITADHHRNQSILASRVIGFMINRPWLSRDSISVESTRSAVSRAEPSIQARCWQQGGYGVKGEDLSLRLASCLSNLLDTVNPLEIRPHPYVAWQ